MTEERTQKIQQSLVSAGNALNDLTLDQLMVSAAYISGLQYNLMAAADKIIAAAESSGATKSSGAPKSRKIMGEAPGPYSPLAHEKEPDQEFKSWCKIGAAYAALTGHLNVFMGHTRLTVGRAYKEGRSVVDVCEGERARPGSFKRAYPRTGYYKLTR